MQVRFVTFKAAWSQIEKAGIHMYMVRACLLEIYMHQYVIA